MIKERYFIQNIISMLDEGILMLELSAFLDKTNTNKL